MATKNTSLHVLVDGKNKILAIYEAPAAKITKIAIEAVPAKGQQILEVSAPAEFKKIKTFEEAAKMITPLLAGGRKVGKGETLAKLTSKPA